MTKEEIEKFPKCPGIYLIKNIINDKCYVGQSINIYNRIKAHIYNYTCAHFKTKHLYAAINKYGLENFEFTVLEIVEINCNTARNLNKLEVSYIKKYNSFISGYNETSGAERENGFKLSQVTKNKISKTLKDLYTIKKVSQNTIDANNKITFAYHLKDKYFIEAESRTKLHDILKEQGINISVSSISSVIQNRRLYWDNYVFGNSKEECLNKVEQIINKNGYLIKNLFLITNVETNEQFESTAQQFSKMFNINIRTAQNLLSKNSKNCKLYKQKFKIERI